MSAIYGIPFDSAIRALKKAGFAVLQGSTKHAILSDGTRFLSIPNKNRIHPSTMGGIVRDAGLTVEQFRDLL